MPETFNKTSHQLAKELLALPDLPLRIEGWYRVKFAEPIAGPYGPDGGKSIFICKLPQPVIDHARQLEPKTAWLR